MGTNTAVNKRRHERIKHRANVKLDAPSVVLNLEMRDFSESGLYLFCPDTSVVAVQDQVKVQTLEFEGAPVLDAKIVRLENDIGFAVEFTQ